MTSTKEPTPDEVLGLLAFSSIRLEEETEWEGFGGYNHIASVSWTATYAGTVTLLIDPEMEGPGVTFSRRGFDAVTALQNLYEAAWQQKWIFPRA